MEFNDEQMAAIQAMIDSAVSAKDGEIEALKTQNTTLIGEKRAAKTKADEAEKAKVDVNNDIDAARALIKTQEDAIKTLREERKTVNFDNAILAAVNAKNIDAAFREDMVDLLKFRGSYDEETGVTTIGDKNITDYLDSFLQTEKGKRYIPASPATGGGAPGSGGSRGTAQSMTKDNFDASKFFAMAKDAQTAWAKQNDMPWLIVD